MPKPPLFPFANAARFIYFSSHEPR
jgi:hypothetical protein